MAPATAKPAPDLRIPVEVRVGIIGHCTTEQDKQVASAIEAIRQELEEVLDRSPSNFSLATGFGPDADRFWLETSSHAAAARKTLWRWLPGDARRYLRSFKTVHARTQFIQLVQGFTEKLPQRAGLVPAQLEEAICGCDILIAIWNSEEALASERIAPLMSFALEKVGRTLYWIDPETGRIKRYDNYDSFIDSIRHLNLYNGAHLTAKQLAADRMFQIDRLRDLGAESGVPARALEPLYDRIVPHFVRAEHLASWWQSWYVRAGLGMYLLAALAVATAASATFWRREMAFLEVVEMVAILLIICFSELLELLRRWLDYRYLAERLRAAIYLYVAGLSRKTPGEAAASWMDRALSYICNFPAREPAPGDLQAIRNFALEGWIDHQRKYYFDRSAEFEGRQQILLNVGFGLFLLTAFSALFHATSLHGPERLWESIGIISPAFGASVAGFRAFREYRRTSLQYGAMVRNLNRIADGLKTAPTLRDVKDLLSQADVAIVNEHQGWRGLVHVHEPIDEI